MEAAVTVLGYVITKAPPATNLFIVVYSIVYVVAVARASLA